jgi:hypothetical protein
MKDASNIIAADLSTPERILLFCLASGTEWAEAGVTGATVTAMVVRGLVDRDAAARLVLTPDGRVVLNALLGALRPADRAGGQPERLHRGDSDGARLPSRDAG